MQATRKTSSRTRSVCCRQFLLRSNQNSLQTPVYRDFNHAIWPIKTRHSHSLCSTIEFIKHLTRVCLFCFGRVSLHFFNSCTRGIIHGPISSRCMGVASRWNYNGECMIKIFWGGAGVVTLSKPPPLRTTSPLHTLCFKMFLERSLNDPHHPTSKILHNFRLYSPPVLRCFWKDLLMTPHHLTSSILHCTPLSIQHPSPP